MFKLLPAILITTLLFVNYASASTASDVFDKASKSTVVILAYDNNGDATKFGSGVVLPDGSIATNCHVIEDASKISVRYYQKEYQAEIKYTDWDRDTCSITAKGLKAQPVSIGSTQGLRVGSRVYAIGAPRGLELTISEGIVSSLRSVEGGQYVQITAPISHGSSGGGLFDSEGRLLGLTSFYMAEGQNLNFALPVEWIAELPERQTEALKADITFVDWISKAIVFEETDEWGKLLEHSQQWTQASPDNAFAWFSLGSSYIYTDQHSKAVDAYKQGLRIDQNNDSAWNNLGLAYENKNQHSKAIDAFQQALRADPDSVAAWNNLASVYHDIDQHSKAIDAFQQALRIDPDNFIIWVNLGTTYGRSNQHLKAIDAFQQALIINPDNVTAWFNLGVTYKILGETRQVMEIYQRLRSLDEEVANRFFDKIILP